MIVPTYSRLDFDVTACTDDELAARIQHESDVLGELQVEADRRRQAGTWKPTPRGKPQRIENAPIESSERIGVGQAARPRA